MKLFSSSVLVGEDMGRMMGKLGVLVAVVVLFTAFLAYKGFDCMLSYTIPDLPKMDENKWWGPGKPWQPHFEVVPFKIEIPDGEEDYLKRRLGEFLDRPLTPPLEEQGFQYGFNSHFLKQVVKFWRDEYDVTKRLAFLNQYPQYKTEINGLSIHFLWVKPEPYPKKKVVPLLLLHGWPGSVREFYEVIPLLTTPRNDTKFVFEVIVPSLPGYGFSQGSAKPGFGPAQIAVVLKNLMTRLKFEKFYVAGGDWGSIIGRIIGQLYPKNVLGFHSTMCVVNTPRTTVKMVLGSVFPSMVVDSDSVNKLYPLKDKIFGLIQEMGYFLLQSTKPDTIGAALSDTPAGLAGYILEKFSTWTNREWKNLPDGGLTRKYSLTALLDNVMMYWLSRSIMTSQRLYSENFTPETETLNKIPIVIPTACARFENELLWLPKDFLEEQYVNLMQVTDIQGGGHFAAFEEPTKFSADLWSAVKKFQTFHSGSSRPVKS